MTAVIRRLVRRPGTDQSQEGPMSTPGTQDRAAETGQRKHRAGRHPAGTCDWQRCPEPGNSWSVWPNGARGWHCDVHATAVAMSLEAERNAAADQGTVFQLGIRVTAAEMKDWPTERINRFFAGIAMARSAAQR